MPATDLLRLFAVALLVALNAFFVAAEFALVSIRETRIQQLVASGRLGARAVQKLHHNLDEVLNAVQFGITIASLALGWVGEPALAHLFEQPLHGIPYANIYSHAIALTVAFMLITYLHVILGEVVPKSLALQRSERIALAVAAPMNFFMTLFRPFLYVMNSSSRVILRLFGGHPVREGGVHSPEELKLIVTASRHVGLLPALQEEMIHNALELGNLSVREIMVPRRDIFSLPADMPLEEATTRVVDEQHSRVPVYEPERGPEHIIGLVYSKDLSRFMQVRLNWQARSLDRPTSMNLRLRHVMRDVMLVPETKTCTDLLQDFKQRKRHLAIVVDEFGSTAGLVTVEDVIEQLVGELEDEFDVAEVAPLPLGSGTVVLDGGENIRDLSTQIQLVLPREEGFETLAGFVLWKLGNIPRVGEWFEFENRRYTVVQMEGHRIARVKVEPVETPEPDRQEARG